MITGGVGECVDVPLSDLNPRAGPEVEAIFELEEI
jgi:hypothetical protein